MYKGIDISQWQGSDFRISDHSPDFVIVRGGYWETVDPLANNYIAQAEALGIPWGIYWYSYSLSAKDAAIEAGACLKFLDGRKPPLGVWIDMEDADNYKRDHGFPGNDTITIICREFCAAMRDRGLYSGIYASRSWFDSKIMDTSLPRWIAAWGYNDGVNYPDLSGECVMHQYRGSPLDLDIIFDMSVFGRPTESDTLPTTIDIDAMAREVIDGKWSNGLERKDKLGAWFYKIVQTRVNQIYNKERGTNGTL